MTDQSRFRLSQMEQAFRTARLQSKHRTQPAATQRSVDAAHLRLLLPPLLPGKEQPWARECNSALQNSNKDLELVHTFDAASGTESDDDGPSSLLEEMQTFLKELAARRGSLAPPPMCSGHARAKLEALQIAACGGEGAEGGSGSNSSDEEGSKSGNDSGRLSWAAAHRASGAPPSSAAAARPSAMLPSPAEATLLQRLAAVEARLSTSEALQAEVARLRSQVESLQQEKTRLSSDLEEFVSHTSTLITSLQAQLSSQHLAGGRRQPAAATDADPTWAVHASNVQAAAAGTAMRAAKEAAALASSHVASAAAAAAPEATDALANVQLPAFSQRFASSMAKPLALADAHTCNTENAPPQPRQLPRVFAPSA